MKLYNIPKMETFLIFITENLVAFFLLTALIFALIFHEGKKGGNKIDHSEATRMINRENATVIDIRNTAEFSEGHLVNSINISEDNISEQINTIEKNKEIPILLICKNGSSSKKAGMKLIKLGYANVNLLSGGIIGWQTAGLPLLK